MMKSDMMGDWAEASDNIWKDRHGHWYKADENGNLWVSTNGRDWTRRRSQMWFGPNGQLYRVGKDGMVWVRGG